MKKKRHLLAAAALALLMGTTTGAGPAAAARVSKDTCTVTVWQAPSRLLDIVTATAIVTCWQDRLVEVQHVVRESDGRTSNSIRLRSSGWLFVPAGGMRAVTTYAPCRSTELGPEEYYQGARLAVIGFDASRYSPWTTTVMRSISC